MKGQFPEVAGAPDTDRYIDQFATVHPTAKVWHYARIMAGVELGPQVSVGGGTEIGNDSVIHHRARVGANCFLPHRTLVGEAAFVGPGVTCTDDRHPFVPNPDDPPYHAEPPVIEQHANLGAGVVLMPGVRIGAGATVGAFSRVDCDIPPGETWAGNPARKIERIERRRTAHAGLPHA